MDKTQKIMTSLDFLYASNLNQGKRVDSAFQLAGRYQDKYLDSEQAISSLIYHEALKAGSSGFLTGIGGGITLPLALPANIAGMMYLQMRLIMAIAVLRGYDIHDERVKMLIYLYLCGRQAQHLAGIDELGMSLSFSQCHLTQLTKGVMIKMSQQIALKLSCQLGRKGLTSVTRIIPIIGGVINGGIDYLSTALLGRYVQHHLEPFNQSEQVIWPYISMQEPR